MPDPFAEAAAVLSAGVLGTDVTVKRGATTLATTRALVGSRDNRDDVGLMRIAQDVLELELAVADVPDVAKGDLILRGTEAWEVREQPQRDPLGLYWRLSCAAALP